MTSALLSLVLLVPGPVAADAECGSAWRRVADLDVTDPTQAVRVELAPDLVLLVRSAPHARVPSMGWTLAVVEDPLDAASRNLLYSRDYHHGAYPTDFTAWIHRRRYYPDTRDLPVWGTGYEVRGELVEPHTEIVEDVPVFTAGRLVVSVRDRTDCPSPAE